MRRMLAPGVATSTARRTTRSSPLRAGAERPLTERFSRLGASAAPHAGRRQREEEEQDAARTREGGAGARPGGWGCGGSTTVGPARSRRSKRRRPRPAGGGGGARPCRQAADTGPAWPRLAGRTKAGRRRRTRQQPASRAGPAAPAIGRLQGGSSQRLQRLQDRGG